MQTLGHIHNGVVILDGGISLPEGTRVSVSVLPTALAAPEIECVPGKLPLVRSAAAGSVDLTNERIYEILDAEDVQALKSQWNVPS